MRIRRERYNYSSLLVIVMKRGGCLVVAAVVVVVTTSTVVGAENVEGLQFKNPVPSEIWDNFSKDYELGGEFWTKDDAMAYCVEA